MKDSSRGGSFSKKLQKGHCQFLALSCYRTYLILCRLPPPIVVFMVAAEAVREVVIPPVPLGVTGIVMVDAVYLAWVIVEGDVLQAVREHVLTHANIPVNEEQRDCDYVKHFYCLFHEI
ncbi:MAG: hypothetical protein IKP36_13215 [Bacteroidaceae bacterium]|nr:hypothetical protein [Bacteroidaceae bacterium]